MVADDQKEGGGMMDTRASNSKPPSLSFELFLVQWLL